MCKGPEARRGLASWRDTKVEGAEHRRLEKKLCPSFFSVMGRNLGWFYLQQEATGFRWGVTRCKFCLKTMILSVWESGSQGGRAEAGKPQEGQREEGSHWFNGAGTGLRCAEGPSRGQCRSLSGK